MTDNIGPATVAPLLTPAEVARRLGMSVKTLTAHVAAGNLPYVSIGTGRIRRRRRFTEEAIAKFVADQSRRDVPLSPRPTRRFSVKASAQTPSPIGFAERRRRREEERGRRARNS